MTKRKPWYETKNSNLRQRCYECEAFKKDNFASKYDQAAKYSWCTKCKKETETFDEVAANIEEEMRHDAGVW